MSRAPERWLRPRVVLCAVLGVIDLSVALVAATGRQAFEANLLRLRGSRVRPDLEVRISVSVAGDAENAKVVTARFLGPGTAGAPAP